MSQSRCYRTHTHCTCDCSKMCLSCFNFSGLPQRATQYSLPWVWRALRDNAAALFTTIPLKWDNRGEVKSCFPSVLLYSLQLAAHLYSLWPPHTNPISSCSPCHWEPHATLPYLVTSLLCRTSSFPSLFCLVLLLACSPCFLHDLPRRVQSGVWFTSTEIWCLTLKAEQRQGHMEKYLQAVSHWLITHPRPHLYNHDGFCQMLSCCFPPCPTWFIHLSQW